MSTCYQNPIPILTNPVDILTFSIKFLTNPTNILTSPIIILRHLTGILTMYIHILTNPIHVLTHPTTIVTNPTDTLTNSIIVASGRCMTNGPSQNLKWHTYVAATLRREKNHGFYHCGGAWARGHKSKVRAGNHTLNNWNWLLFTSNPSDSLLIASGARARVSILAERELIFRKSP